MFLMKNNRLVLVGNIGAGYFFMFLTIIIINPIKLIRNKPNVSKTIIKSQYIAGYHPFQLDKTSALLSASDP